MTDNMQLPVADSVSKVARLVATDELFGALTSIVKHAAESIKLIPRRNREIKSTKANIQK